MMTLKEDISPTPAHLRGPIPSLDNTFRSLLADLLPYRTRWQAWRSRLALGLLKLANVPVQKKLLRLQAEGPCDWFAESIQRTYLECRESLAFFNAYQVHLYTDEQKTLFERAAQVLASVQKMVITDDTFARSCRTYRVAEPECDNLVEPPAAGYGVLLVNGQMLVLPHTLPASADKLQQWSLMSKQRAAYDTATLSLGEASALARQDWYELLHAARACHEFSEALNVLRSADFILCLDMDQALSLSNRFFDKAIQIVVDPVSTYLIFEHAAVDGQHAVSMGEALAANCDQAPHTWIEFLSPTDNSNMHLWTTRVVHPSAAQLDKAHQYLEQVSSEFVRKRHWFPELDAQFFASITQQVNGAVSVDNIIQLAMALAFFRTNGRVPSVYEPVSLAHLPPRRLDFISPLSTAAVDVIQSLDKGDPVQVREQLLAAIASHRARIRQSKKGEGALAHLLALASAEFPDNKQRCVRIQRRRRRLMSRLSHSIGFLAHRDMMVSNGGTSPYLESFSTIVHQPDMLGVGYLIGARGLALDLQLHGACKEAIEPGLFIHHFTQSLQDLVQVLLPGVDQDTAAYQPAAATHTASAVHHPLLTKGGATAHARMPLAQQETSL